jgi:putative Mg2+ transporter-C (MgtC) family protein
MTMPEHVTWFDVVVRLACAFIAGAIIGYNRGEHGKIAGLRTTLLVCLAAAVAMLQMNYLLALAGRPRDSFVMNDLMRLPLGILTGVGFIGAGAILRRRNLVIGVTTAATLWYVTVIGLCFGGNQILLGWAATAVGALVLWGMKPLEGLMTTEHHAKLVLTTDESGPAELEIREQLRDGGVAVTGVSLVIEMGGRRYTFNVREVGKPIRDGIPRVVDELGDRRGVSAVEWRRLD